MSQMWNSAAEFAKNAIDNADNHAKSNYDPTVPDNRSHANFWDRIENVGSKFSDPVTNQVNVENQSYGNTQIMNPMDKMWNLASNFDNPFTGSSMNYGKSEIGKGKNRVH